MNVTLPAAVALLAVSLVLMIAGLRPGKGRRGHACGLHGAPSAGKRPDERKKQQK